MGATSGGSEGSTSASLAVHGDRDVERRPEPGGTCDLERAAERLDSVSKARQPRAAGQVGASDAVVVDLELQHRAVAVDVDTDDRCARVLRGVGKCLRD